MPKKLPTLIGLYDQVQNPDPNLLGGKGAGLVRMAAEGIPVPPGCIIPISAFDKVSKLDVVKAQEFCFTYAASVIDYFTKVVVPIYGYMPLVSVRSGAPISMPGMMDTVLNLGLTNDNFDDWSCRLGAQAAYDTKRRFYEMYGTTVFGVSHAEFQNCRNAFVGDLQDGELTAIQLQALSEGYETMLNNLEVSIPDTLLYQLTYAILAVFGSWGSERAVAYRQANNIPDSLGTAVVIQSMVFGNLNENSGSGVYFTANPSTGQAEPMGEFLPMAQGEDVVAGIRTPLPISALLEWKPNLYTELKTIGEKLETLYKDAQDIEFTIQDDKLYLLQTRAAKRSALAAFNIAHRLESMGVIDKQEALSRVSVRQYLQLKTPTIPSSYVETVDLVGIAASSGVVTGRAVLSIKEALEATDPVILVRKETTPDDFSGMLAAVGIITSTGGATSHAAVVARGMDKPCIVGCTDLKIVDYGATISASIAGVKVTNETMITMCGATGRVWLNKQVPVQPPVECAAAQSMLTWGNSYLEFDMSKPTTLPTTGVVCLDFSACSMEQVLNILEAVQQDYPELSGVIRLTPDVYLDSSDHSFLNFLSANAPYWNIDRLNGLVKYLNSESLSIRWQVLPVQAATQITQKFFGQLNEVSTLAELKSAEGLMVMSSTFRFLLSFSQGLDAEGIETLVSAFSKAKVLPDFVPLSRMPFELFRGVC